MKKSVIILSVAALAGVAAIAVGLALGAQTQFYVDKTGFHTAGKSTAETIREMDAEPFGDIEIDVGSSNIEILEADRYGYEVDCQNTNKMVCVNKDGRLAITQEGGFSLFRFNFSFKSSSIKVYIPRDTQLGNVSIADSSGNVVLKGLSCANLAVKATSGRTELFDTAADTITVEKSSGGIGLDNCAAPRFDLSLTSGSLKAGNIDSGQMKLKLTSGSAKIEGKLTGETEISVISGNVDLNIDGNKNDYNRDISVVSGNVRIDGDRVRDDDFTNPAAKNSLRVDSTSGDITVNFTG